MTKRIISTILAVTLAASAAITAFAVEYGAETKNQPTKVFTQTFSDVSQSHWASEYISEMVSRGVLSGYPDGAFRPDNTVTRAEFAKIMTVASGIPIEPVTQTYFNDTKADAWYTPYVNAAKNYLSGYTTPYGSHYYPDQPALREDIAVALVKLKGYDTFGADESMLTAMFSDVGSISDGAKKYVATAIEKGLVSGYDDGTFRGQATITRAEAAAMLWRAYQYGNSNKQFDVTTPTPTTAPVTTPAPTAEPIPTPTAAPTVAPTPEATKEPAPTPEPEKMYAVEKITKVNMNSDDSYRFTTYNSDENVAYYYDEEKNIINAYNIESDEISEYFDVSELQFPSDENGNYYKDFSVDIIYYDNYRSRMYVSVTAGSETDIGGLEDKEAKEKISFYIENGEVSQPLEEGRIFAACEEGPIKGNSENMYVLDPDTGEKGVRLSGANFNDVGVIVSGGKEYVITESYDTYITSSFMVYDFDEWSTKREFAVASRCGIGDDEFYVWDIDGRIIRCALDGNLSVLLDINDVEIKDMMNIKSKINGGRIIVTADEENIIFFQDDHLRIIRKA